MTPHVCADTIVLVLAERSLIKSLCQAVTCGCKLSCQGKKGMVLNRKSPVPRNQSFTSHDNYLVHIFTES